MSQGGVGVFEPFAEGVDVFLRGIAAETDAQGSVDGFGVKAHGFQHVAAGALLTGGALGDIDLAGFEEVQFIRTSLRQPGREMERICGAPPPMTRSSGISACKRLMISSR